jgi:hypothetical protein
MRRWEGANESNSSKSRKMPCEGSWMVMVSVSNCHHTTIFHVAQVASYFNIFLIDAGSCLCGLSLGSRRRRTLSREYSNIRLMCCRWLALPCTMPIKSSTYTSHALTGRGPVCNGVAVAGRGRGAVPDTLTGEGVSSLIGDSETASKRCLATTFYCSFVLARSATVSVAAVNKVGDCFHPIGSTKCKPINCSSPSWVGNMIACLGMSFGRIAML